MSLITLYEGCANVSRVVLWCWCSQDMVISFDKNYLVLSGPPFQAALADVVHPPPAEQMFRRGTVRARGELRLNPFDEPMKMRARPSRHANFLHW